MSDETLVRHCAPTLAGLKTGSLFSTECESRSALFEDMRRINAALRDKGLILLPLRIKNSRALLYLFRPRALGSDMQDQDAARLLHEAGYTRLTPAGCVSELRRRFDSSDAFPHEIGLFLSYPPEDVRGFIENHAANYKFSGMWKVYGDVTKARRTFDLYDRCTRSYTRQIRSGKSLSDLTVKQI